MDQLVQTLTETASDLRSTVKSLAFHSRMPAAAKGKTRLFVYRDGGIGDILCTLPALAALREKWPDSYVVYAAYRSFHPLIQMSGLADAVIESGGYAKWGKLTDPLYNHVYQPHYEDEIWTDLPLVHVVDDFARKMDVTLRDRQPRLPVPPDLQERMRPHVEALRRTGPVIAAQTGPSWAVRTWPQEYWAALVERLRLERDAAVILIGADFHQESQQAAALRVPGAIDWIGRHSLSETAAVISLCDAFIGIDSGLLHMAGAVGTPSVGIFGPVDPQLRLPPTTPAIAVQASHLACLGCHHRMPRAHWKTGCPLEIACMRTLPADAVFDALSRLLLCRPAPPKN